jgi:hypothetical protein
MRFTVSRYNQPDDIEAFVAALRRAWPRKIVSELALIVTG